MVMYVYNTKTGTRRKARLKDTRRGLKKATPKQKKQYRAKFPKRKKQQIKKIVKQELNKTIEYNNVHTVARDPDDFMIGHPSLYPHNADDTVIETAIEPSEPQPRAILLTNYPTTHKLNTGITTTDTGEDEGSALYLTKQKMFLKSIRIYMELRSPFGKIQTRRASSWCNVYLYIIRTNDRIDCEDGIPLHKLFKSSPWESSFSFNKDKKISSGYTIIKKAKINMNPNKGVLLQLNQGDDEEPVFAPRKKRIYFDCQVNKWINLLRSKSSDDVHTDARPEGNKNNYNYWFVIWSHQEKQSRASGTKLYNSAGYSGTSSLLGDQGQGVSMSFSTELIGYGADGNIETE